MIHCSHLPRLFACPASKKAPGVEIELKSEWSELGTCVHQIVGAMVAADEETPPIKRFVDQWQDTVDPKEVEYLAWNAAHIWKKFRGEFATVAVEQAFESNVLHGTPDFVGKKESGELVIIDWKTGWKERDYTDQLMGYATLVTGGCPDLDTRIVTVWLRSRDSYDVKIVSPAELQAWLDRLDAVLKSETFSPGEHCTFCPMEHECAARMALVRSAIGTFQAMNDDAQLPALQQVIDRYPLYPLAKKALERFHDVAKAMVRQAGGSAKLSDGRVLSIEQSNPVKVKTSPVTFGVIAEHLRVAPPSQIIEQFPEIITISKTKLEEKVKELAPYRKGAEYIRQLTAALTDANCLEVTTKEELRLKKGE